MGREGPSVQIGAGLASVVGRWLQLSPRAHARSGAGRRRGRAGGRLQHAGRRRAVRARGNHRRHERVAARLDRRRVGRLGRRRAIDSRQRAAVSRAGVSARASGRTGRLCRRSAISAASSRWCSAKGCSALRAAVPAACRRARVFQPAIGGLVIGALLLYSPAVMGVGYEYVDQALNGGLLLKTMVDAVLPEARRDDRVVQRPATPAASSPRACTSARWRAAQSACSSISIAPFPTGDPGAYALVGMGTLFAGIIRAPMTSVFMIFEITQDYQILVPLMVANTAELRHLAALSADARLSRAAAPGRHPPAIGGDARPARHCERRET